MYTRRGAQRADSRCVGYPIPGVAVRIRAGRGPIEVRSRGRALTYVDEPGLWAGQWDRGWWQMGDLGHRGRWGCVHLLDREIDHIEGLDSALEVEDTLMNRLPQLREVVLVPRAEGGAQPVICTHGGSPLDPAAWQRAVRDLPAMADPVQFAWEDLPHTATLKVRRPHLRTLLEHPSH
jgi:acyl-coenzyme A synthetase/AMP-(fatty) acid ligase